MVIPLLEFSLCDTAKRELSSMQASVKIKLVRGAVLACQIHSAGFITTFSPSNAPSAIGKPFSSFIVMKSSVVIA